MDTRLLDLPINEFTSSELLRLVLRPQDLSDNVSLDSDMSEDDENDQDEIVSTVDTVLGTIQIRFIFFFSPRSWSLH